MNVANLLLIHVAATLCMVGVIWFVQLVHYPLFQFVGSSSFSTYEQINQSRTSWVVAPLMVTELVTAAALLFTDLSGPSREKAWIGTGLLFVIWMSTALLQVPLHRKLSAGFDARRIRLLIRSNWIRTVAWSARGLIALLLLRG